MADDKLSPEVVALYSVAQALVREVDRKNDLLRAPQKYTTPWGHVTRLRLALEAAEKAHPELVGLTALRKTISLDELTDALRWIAFRARESYEKSHKLRADDARQFMRIAERAEQALGTGPITSYQKDN